FRSVRVGERLPPRSTRLARGEARRPRDREAGARPRDSGRRPDGGAEAQRRRGAGPEEDRSRCKEENRPEGRFSKTTRRNGTQVGLVQGAACGAAIRMRGLCPRIRLKCPVDTFEPTRLDALAA